MKTREFCGFFIYDFTSTVVLVPHNIWSWHAVFAKAMIGFFAAVFLFCTVMLNIAVCAVAPASDRGYYQVMLGDFEVIALSDCINKRPVEQQLQLLYGHKEKLRDQLARAFPEGAIEAG